MKTLIFLFSTFLSNIAFSQSLIMSLGDTRALPLTATNVWVQNREIIKAEASLNDLKITALSLGRTTLKIGKQHFVIQVIHPSQESSLKELSQTTEKMVGLHVEVAQGNVQVQGTLYRFKDWQEISKIAEKNKFTFRMKAELIGAAKSEAQNYFEAKLKEAHLPPQKVIFSSGAEVRVNTEALLFSKYQEIFEPFGVQILKDETHLDIQPTVKVEITVAEVRKSAALSYGMKWPQSYRANVLGDGQSEIEKLAFEATAFESQGLGKILASPNILCKSGKEAEFLAGGEFPIKIVQYRNQDVLWKRYGILLKVRPLADTSGRISLSIDTEITTLDEARTVDNIPGLLTNKVSSHFDITKPQTIALSGLLKNDNGKNSDGVPWLGRLPILGPLFASKAFRNNETELVIFVRPSIYEERRDSEFQEASPQHLSHKGLN